MKMWVSLKNISIIFVPRKRPSPEINHKYERILYLIIIEWIGMKYVYGCERVKKYLIMCNYLLE